MGSLGSRSRGSKLTCLLIASIGAAVLADQWAAPSTKIFASPWGHFGLTLLVEMKSPAEAEREQAEKPQEDRQFFRVTASLFRPDKDGRPIAEWTAPVGFVPNQVCVSDRGEVVSIDEYAKLGYRHALVVFDAKGGVLADYRLEDLLTAGEIRAHATATVSSRFWNDGARFDFNRGFFVARLKWGKVITVELASGKLWPGFDPDAYDTDAAYEKALKRYREKHKL